MRTQISTVLLMLIVLSSQAQDDGAKLLNQIKDAYASLQTYCDNGVTTDVFSNTTQRIPFSTYFSKPSKARFNFTCSHPYPPLAHEKWEYAVWYDGTNAYFSTDKKAEKRDSIYGAWGGAVGISGGTAHHVPSFLLQIALGSGVYGGRAWRITGHEKVGEVPCIKCDVQQWKAGRSVTVWVGKGDLLIRKIVESYSASIYTVIEYQSVSTNSAIDEAMFSAP